MVKAKTEQVAHQQEAGMAVEDQVQAAVERHVAAACTGHTQELENMRLQMEQSLDARAQVPHLSLSKLCLRPHLLHQLLPGCDFIQTLLVLSLQTA